MKPCCRCGEMKPLEDFPSRKGVKDGRGSYCPPCLREKNREGMRRWRAAHPDRVREQSQKDRQRLKQRQPNYHREWYERNIEKERTRSRAVMRRWREENPQAERQTRQRYRANNLEAVRDRERANTHRRRAQMRSADPNLAEMMSQLLTKPCVYCGSTENVTVDHIVPLSRGGKHEAGNLAPACYSCNCSKSDRLLSEWNGRRVA